jgi:hypothetical protein
MSWFWKCLAKELANLTRLLWFPPVTTAENIDNTKDSLVLVPSQSSVSFIIINFVGLDGWNMFLWAPPPPPKLSWFLFFSLTSWILSYPGSVMECQMWKAFSFHYFQMISPILLAPLYLFNCIWRCASNSISEWCTCHLFHHTVELCLEVISERSVSSNNKTYAYQLHN